MALGYGRAASILTNTDHTVLIGGPSSSKKVRLLNTIRVQNGSTTSVNVRAYVLVGSGQFDWFDTLLDGGETLSKAGPDGLVKDDFLKLVLSATPSGGRGQVSVWATYADVERVS